jgi:hypothetical protein
MNVFEKAKKIPAKKSSEKVKREEDTFPTAGLELYAEIDALEKALAALKKTVRGDVEASMKDHFVAHGPENYKGRDGQASASLELRKRSSASGLSEAEQLLVSVHDIETEVVEDRPETYVINPAYAQDPKTLKKVAAALSKIKDLPEDFLMYQESTKKTVMTEHSIEQVFKINDPDTIRELLPIVGTLAIKPKTTKSITEVVETIKEVLG